MEKYNMRFNESDLARAQREGIISDSIHKSLLNFLTKSSENSENKEQASNFNTENFLYFLGAGIIASTMLFYLRVIWLNHGNVGLLILSILYFVLFSVIGKFLWKTSRKTPGGLLFVCAVCVIPLLVFAFELLIGLMPENMSYKEYPIRIKSSWIIIEISTILVGSLFFKYTRYSLITLPICGALWGLFMDIVPLLFGQISYPTWGMSNLASAVFALLILGLAFKFDPKDSKNISYENDDSYFLYIIGATTLCATALSISVQFHTWTWKHFELSCFLGAVFSCIYMLLSIILQRKVFMLWGAMGFWGYLGHLCYKTFADSQFFQLVLVIFGLLIIMSGVYYAKNSEKIEHKIRKVVTKIIKF